MKVTHYFTASLTAPTPAVLYAVKGDGARMAVARLMAGAEPWAVPEGVTAGVSYTLPDKTPGYYDRLEDGTPACMIAGNLVSAVLAPVLTGQAGAVKVSIVLRDADGGQVATFPFQLRVEQAPGIVDAEGVPAMGNGFEGKLFYGGPGGALTALALGDGVRVKTTEDGTLALVAEGGSGGAGCIDEEEDPTVPAWAKQPQKPAYTAQEVGALPAGTKIPGKTSELTNDAGFVDKAVSDLTNYYTKAQTQELIAAIPRFRVTVVQQLPAAGEELVLYLVPFATAEGQYLEYIWADGRWEIIGSQRVDLTGYATEEWVQEYVEEHSGQNPGQDGEDGFSPIATVTQTTTGATISITDKNGTTTATVTNGKDGKDGADGQPGKDGTDGAPGEKGDKGDKGDPGEPGKDGANGKDGTSATHSWNGTVLTITSASGTSSANLKGDKGDAGADGADGADGKDGTPAAVEIGPSTTEDELAAMYADGVRLVVTNPSENLIPSAIAQNGVVFNGCGYRKEYRLTDTGGVTSLDDAVLTGFIPYTHGKTIQIIGGLHQGDDYGNYMAAYNSAFEPILVKNVRKWARESGGQETVDENNVKSFTVNTNNVPDIASAAYIRISLRPCVGRNLQVRYI